MNQPDREYISCPCCQSRSNRPWAEENGYLAVKCSDCGMVYLNPRPCQALISEAVETGVHEDVDHDRTAVGSRDLRKVRRYRAILGDVFRDVWSAGAPVSWLDVGAGYGEVVEAVMALAPNGSIVQGVEPMRPKARSARSRGLAVEEGYLSGVGKNFNVISLINVFSHIPEFEPFLADVRRALTPRGELFLETGNIGDLATPADVPTELDLPDHLTFAGEGNIARFLAESDFTIVSVTRIRKDNLENFAKNLAKKALGRKVPIRLPYTSDFRTLLVRARLEPGYAA